MSVDAYSETALVTITKKGGNDYEYATLTESVSIDFGDKGGESIPTLAGGRLWKNTPQEDTTITLDIYPVGIEPGAGMAQWFWGDDSDTTEPLSVDAKTTRYLFRVAILWTDDPNATSAAGSTNTNYYAYRIVAKDCRLIGFKPTYTDKVLKATVTFKVPPFDKSGNALITEESTQGSTAGLSELSSYS